MHLIAPTGPDHAATRGTPGEASWVLLAAAARYAAEERIVESPTLDFDPAEEQL